MPALKNQRHERFCQYVAKGDSDLIAYMKARKCSRKCAITNAWRMRESEGIEARIRELQAATVETHLMDMKERRLWLARAKRVNIHTFDPEKDGDLAEEIIESDGKKRYKLPSKRACIMDDARLAGELIEHQDLTSNGEALPTVMPKIVVNLPASAAYRRDGASRS